jgi:hypothetical protein
MTEERRVVVPPGWLPRLRRRAGIAAGAAGAVAALGVALDAEHFYRAYLLGFLFLAGVPLGCLGLALLTHMTGGGWALVARRLLEAAARTVPLLALLFLPVLLGRRSLYLWTDAEAVAANELLQHKTPYLNVPFFVLRAAMYFLVWWIFAFLLDRWSVQQDQSRDPRLHRRLQLWSAAGLCLYMLTASFAAFDWLMSLDPLWFSSLYGMHFVVGQGTAALCFVILLGRWLARSEPLARVFAGRHFDDYGKLLLAFVLLWVYMTYSQFLIIWSANLPEEIGWYLHRQAGGYLGLSLLVFALHFVLPFFLLLSQAVRRRPERLAWVAAPVLLGRWLDLVWQVAPSLHPGGPVLHWLDPVLTVALGGTWLAVFAWELERRALLPLGDPHLQEALADA